MVLPLHDFVLRAFCPGALRCPPRSTPLAIPAAVRKNADMPNKPARITVPGFRSMKGEGRKIVVLTAYDYPTARLLDESGVDVILVGDSLSMVVQGRETTLPVTLDEMIYHAEIVGRAVERRWSWWTCRFRPRTWAYTRPSKPPPAS